MKAYFFRRTKITFSRLFAYVSNHKRSKPDVFYLEKGEMVPKMRPDYLLRHFRSTNMVAPAVKSMLIRRRPDRF